MTYTHGSSSESEFKMIHSLVERILRAPLGSGQQWSLQGFGMLRLYMPDKALRLHVWDSRYGVPKVSLHHDHPWDFSSLIIAGRLRNIRYTKEVDSGITLGQSSDIYNEQTIQCGPGGCVKSDPVPVRLFEHPVELYEAGDWYRQAANEIHMSAPEDGTVTLIDRTFNPDTEHARVFWQGPAWVSAEPREATSDEVISITSNAIKTWFIK